jgi:hypothetical protein
VWEGVAQHKTDLCHFKLRLLPGQALEGSDMRRQSSRSPYSVSGGWGAMRQGLKCAGLLITGVRNAMNGRVPVGGSAFQVHLKLACNSII